MGREREMAEVERSLASTRLLTLTGAGGSGKTRLALEVARDLVGAYPDGVWLVELAPLSEEALVPKAVAEALGVPERPAQPLTDTLAEVLRRQASCSSSWTTASTSWRLPRISWTGCSTRARTCVSWPPAAKPSGWKVRQGGSCPRSRCPSDGYIVARGAGGYESVRLFVERARGRDPSFSLSPHNARAVAEICGRLEGIPLAIELAAARVGTLSLEQISERLGDSLRLLTRGGRTAEPRQRTLKGDPGLELRVALRA